MPKTLYKLLESRQKMQIKAYGVMIALLLVCAGFYSYKQWQDYQLASVGTEKAKEFITYLRDEVTSEKTKFENKKSEFESLRKTTEDKLATIFPAQDDYTALTRQIDSYEVELSKLDSPFEVSNIDYDAPLEFDKYYALPLRMSIRSSRENFTKFLHMIENSGALNDQLRLMDISSIRLNFEDLDNETSTSGMINFVVQINAYYQK